MARNIGFAAFAALCCFWSCGPEDNFDSFGSSEDAHIPVGSVCVEAGRREPGDPVTLLPRNGRNECIATEEPLRFSLVPGRSSMEFRLYGVPRVEYCLTVIRTYGYVTILHGNGEVARDENRFMWCVSPQSTVPESMTVRSLTVRAQFELSVP